MLDGKSIIITGGGSGIGRATALACAREGGRVCVSDLDREAAERSAQELRDQGHDAFAVHADVTRDAEVSALLDAVLARWGQIDVAINNAGIISPYQLMADLTDDAWRRQIDVNLVGVILCMRAELRHMIAAAGGAIVNVASVAGTSGVTGGSAYCAAKHGVVGLTRCAALEYADRPIRINAVCPGYIDTPLHALRAAEGRSRDVTEMSPMRRSGHADEVAEAIVWLASDRASFVTGVALPVDGGFSAR